MVTRITTGLFYVKKNRTGGLALPDFETYYEPL